MIPSPDPIRARYVVAAQPDCDGAADAMPDERPSLSSYAGGRRDYVDYAPAAGTDGKPPRIPAAASGI